MTNNSRIAQKVGLIVTTTTLMWTATSAGSLGHRLILRDRDNVFSSFTGESVPLDSGLIKPSIYKLIDSCGVDRVSRVFPTFVPGDTLYLRPDGKTVHLIDLSSYYQVHFADAVSFDAFELAYRKLDTLSELWQETSLMAYSVTPNDPFYASFQQNLQGKAGGGLNFDSAWEITNGEAGQIIGIVDNGVDTFHTELAGKFVGGASTSLVGGDWTTNGAGAHGTFVAGIIAARANNDTGIAGVNWKAKLYVAKFDDV